MPKSRQRKKKRGKRRLGKRPDRRRSLIRQVSHFPLRECRISEGWQESGLAQVSIARNRPDGQVVIASFIVDLGCLGVKSAFANTAISVSDYEGSLVYGAPTPQVPCDPALAVKLIQGAVEYAKQLGFSPDPDFYYAREIFGNIDPESCQETIEYGRDGKPFFSAGPYDDVEKILSHLTQRLGPDGFHYLIPLDNPEEWDVEDDWDEEHEED